MGVEAYTTVLSSLIVSVGVLICALAATSDAMAAKSFSLPKPIIPSDWGCAKTKWKLTKQSRVQVDWNEYQPDERDPCAKQCDKDIADYVAVLRKSPDICIGSSMIPWLSVLPFLPEWLSFLCPWDLAFSAPEAAWHMTFDGEPILTTFKYNVTLGKFETTVTNAGANCLCKFRLTMMRRYTEESLSNPQFVRDSLTDSLPRWKRLELLRADWGHYRNRSWMPPAHLCSFIAVSVRLGILGWDLLLDDDTLIDPSNREEKRGFDCLSCERDSDPFRMFDKIKYGFDHKRVLLNMYDTVTLR